MSGDFGHHVKSRPCLLHFVPVMFYQICGTSLGEILSEEATFPIAAQALDTDIGLKNEFHEFTSEKPDWSAICDDAPQSEGRPSA